MFFLEHFVFVFITKPNHQPACATLILLPSNRGQKIACHCGQSGLTAQSVVVLMQGWLLHSSFLFSFFIVFRRLPKFEGRIFVSLENAVARPKGVPRSGRNHLFQNRSSCIDTQAPFDSRFDSNDCWRVLTCVVVISFELYSVYKFSQCATHSCVTIWWD